MIINENDVNNRYLVRKFFDGSQPSLLVMASTLQQPWVIRDMPLYMTYVLQSIAEKCISCSFCHQFLSSYIGKFTERQDICAVVTKRFSMEWSAKFGDELRQSFDDFLMRIRTEFGFWL